MEVVPHRVCVVRVRTPAASYRSLSVPRQHQHPHSSRRSLSHSFRWTVASTTTTGHKDCLVYCWTPGSCLKTTRLLSQELNWELRLRLRADSVPMTSLPLIKTAISFVYVRIEYFSKSLRHTFSSTVLYMKCPAPVILEIISWIIVILCTKLQFYGRSHS